MRSHLLGICCMAAVVAWASVASAQSPDHPRLAVSASVGVSRPLDTSMTDVYGTRLMPVTVQFDVHVGSVVSAFGAAKWARADGQTVIVGAPIADEAYATSLRVMSYRLGALVTTRVAPRWVLGGGAGVCIASYQETWPDAGLQASGSSTGFLALAEARYAVTARWSAIGRAEYTRLPATAAVGNIRVNLGGVDGSAGLRFSF